MSDGPWNVRDELIGAVVEYVSTRGGMAPAPFTDVLLDGLAPDGGLVVPAEVPTVDETQLEAWRGLTYPELATEVLGLFATDVPRDDLAEMTRQAYATGGFSDPDVVPLQPLDDQVTLVGLSEGPTMAFKDLAMQFLGASLPYVLAKHERVLNVLGATSGDTGSAAEHAFRHAPNVAVFMLSPAGRMSSVQRAQMYSLTEPNIHNLAVDGVFDDCQDLVKEITGDADFKRTHHIGAVNSINIGRVVAQVVYYVWAWLRATDGLDARARAERAISVTVPSGNFGNVYAGHVARRMGLPIRRLVLATNENNVLHEFFSTGVYTPRSREATVATSSPSMDISKASNLERYVWELLGPEEFVKRWSDLERDGELDLRDWLAADPGRELGFVSGESSHADRVATIREVHAATGVVVDPHTADGVAVARRNLVPGETMLVLETAKAAKFPDVISEALGDQAPPLPAELLDLIELPQRTVDVPAEAEVVRAHIAEHALRGR